jgi:succinate dehydrogenase / fumarate reductase flavoprotein subunit
MQGLADGYFVLPYTIGDYLQKHMGEKLDTKTPAFSAVEKEVRAGNERLLGVRGSRSVDSFHKELGAIMWNQCGMARTAAGLEDALAKIPPLREQYWRDLRVTGQGEELNQQLEKAGRVADYFELAELMCRDALERNESAGGHLREEYQTPDGEALRNDDKYMYAAAWEWNGSGKGATLHKEPLAFDAVKPTQRSYK